MDLHARLPKINGEIYFLEKDDIFIEEKPYAFRYDTEDDQIPQTNMTMKPFSIEINNMRGFESYFTLEGNGFEVMKLEEEIPYDYFHNMNTVRKYFDILTSMIRIRLRASSVEVFRFCVRKRHPLFPISTGDKYDFDQPTSVAHVDTTPSEMLECLSKLHPNDTDVGIKRCQWINVWKPLKGPLNDWPLVVCDASKVDCERDLTVADILYPEFMTENFQVHYSDKFLWYYLAGQNTNEMMVFIQADSKDATISGVPHCSFYNPLVPPGEQPRESIEVRLLVRYDA
ncbi:hypothetical protein GQX73_g3868 [Xylaria multiplex]|uniref:CmcJ-like methyltransferase n=1 Tax=Xylaria multiplex TaxID=323545 RepID=A0A7C8MNL7_9PEZI|nr:hypothetical protein GQX73_g3868 [Xylaria multiplex]